MPSYDAPLLELVRSPTPAERRILDLAADVASEDAAGRGELAFLARILVQATLPYRDPGNCTFVRQNGSYTLTLQAPPHIGLPYGRYPRLVLVGARLLAFVREHRLGRVFGEAGYVLASEPDTVRAPDASFVSTERISGAARRGPYVVGAPDLAVEVVSPGDSRQEVAEKVGEYLAAGARAVWVIDPRHRTVTTHLPGRDPVRLGPGETLDGGEYLPGFRLPVSEVFET